MAAECTDERDPFRWEAAAQTDKDPSGRIIGPKADSAWLNVCPDGFRKTLKWISNRCLRSAVELTLQAALLSCGAVAQHCADAVMWCCGAALCGRSQYKNRLR